MRVLKDSVVMTAVRDEGPFIIEWLAWYRMLGFDKVLVIHNDCTDHTPQLLRLLERSGFLTQKKQTPPEGEPPKLEAYRVADRHPLIRKASWAFVCDVDEFLVVHAGDRGAAALAEAIGPDHMGMAINWLIYGSTGEIAWRDGLVHRMFLRSATSEARHNTCFKAFYRDPGKFNQIRSHGPQGWLGNDNWNTDTRNFITGDGRRLETYTINNNPPNATVPERIAHNLAQVNHYAVQSHEKFHLKKAHLSPAAGLERYTDEFFRRFDRNEVANNVVLDYYAEAFDQAYGEICAVPGVMRLHYLCCADLIERSCARHGQDPKDDERWGLHLEQARQLPRH